MDDKGAGGPRQVACPECGSTEIRTVEKAQRGKGSLRDNLGTRLAPGPDKSEDGCLHFLEGMVLTGMGGALVYMGLQEHKPLYTLGGAALALICFFGTIMVVRIDAREKADEEAGAARADELWRPAHFCSGCSSVFCPDGTPWQGVLTTEQFKKFVWTQAGYADQLSPGDKAREAEVPGPS